MQLTVGRGEIPCPRNFWRSEGSPEDWNPILRRWVPKIVVTLSAWRVEWIAETGVLYGSTWSPVEGEPEPWTDLYERPDGPSGDLLSPPDAEAITKALAGFPEAAEELRKKLVDKLTSTQLCWWVAQGEELRVLTEAGLIPRPELTEVRSSLPFSDYDLYKDNGDGLWARARGSLGGSRPLILLDGKWGYPRLLQQPGESYPKIGLSTVRAVDYIRDDITPRQSAHATSWLEALKNLADPVKRTVQEAIEIAERLPTYSAPASREHLIHPGDTLRLPLTVEIRRSPGTLKTTRAIGERFRKDCRRLEELGYECVYHYSSGTGRTQTREYRRSPVDDIERIEALEAHPLVERAELGGPGAIAYVRPENAGRFIGTGGRNVKALEESLGTRIKMRLKQERMSRKEGA